MTLSTRLPESSNPNSLTGPNFKGQSEEYGVWVCKWASRDAAGGRGPARLVEGGPWEGELAAGTAVSTPLNKNPSPLPPCQTQAPGLRSR